MTSYYFDYQGYWIDVTILVEKGWFDTWYCYEVTEHDEQRID